jgi:hypothetical protein
MKQMLKTTKDWKDLEIAEIEQYDIANNEKDLVL